MSSNRTALCVLALVTFLASGAAMAQPTPVHEYRFPGNARDSGSLAMGQGTVGANVTFTNILQGGIGQAAVFAEDQPGSADRINVPNPNFIDFGAGNFSIAFWARRINVESADVDGVLDAFAGDSWAGWEVFFQRATS